MVPVYTDDDTLLKIILSKISATVFVCQFVDIRLSISYDEEINSLSLNLKKFCNTNMQT